MAQLRGIQQHAAFPIAVRKAAERLSTVVTKRHELPFTVDPLSDARLIVGHLVAEVRDAGPP
jgi:hypothetical protein